MIFMSETRVDFLKKLKYKNSFEQARCGHTDLGTEKTFYNGETQTSTK